MSQIATRLTEMGLVLPAPPVAAVGAFSRVRVLGTRAVVSGHGPQVTGGTFWPRFGKVGAEVSAEEAKQAARLVALAILGSLQQAIGDLDRVTAWVRVFGMINAAPGFRELSPVMNGFSELILDLYGPAIGAHARTVIGVSELPFGLPLEIEAEVEIS